MQGLRTANLNIHRAIEPLGILQEPPDCLGASCTLKKPKTGQLNKKEKDIL